MYWLRAAGCRPYKGDGSFSVGEGLAPPEKRFVPTFVRFAIKIVLSYYKPALFFVRSIYLFVFLSIYVFKCIFATLNNQIIE